MLESLHFPDLPDMYRRISLLLVDEEQEAVSELWSSGSSAPPQFPILPLGLPLVQAFFSEASALLVNLALSLLFKYLLRSGVTLRAANAGWLLGVSALVGYKIFYDETL
jgi:PhoPQ-activated pathogenicity-related protein